MTTLSHESIVCTMCGQISEQLVLGSTNTFGSPDLDLRPPEMRRSTMRTWVMECPGCGYVYGDISQAVEIAPGWLQSEEYRGHDGLAPQSEQAGRFIRAALIKQHVGRPMDAMHQYHSAAWASDDAGDTACAIACRKRALVIIEEELKPDGGQEEQNLRLMAADMMRRAGMFDEMIAACESMRVEGEALEKIVAFQLERARQLDSGCYTVSDALERADKA